MFTELTPERIAELKGASRQRGVYTAELKKFAEGDEAGVQVDLSNGTFESKNPNTVMQGFRNAVTKMELTETVNVILNEDNVYLIRRDA